MFDRVSVVILAKNEAETIGRCLDSLLTGQDRREYEDVDLQLVVIDNESTDATASIAASKGAVVLNSDSKFLGELRNIGAAATSGDVLAYIDGDCTASPEWLVSGLRALEHQNVHAVTGVVAIPQDSSWVVRAWVLPGEPEACLTSKVFGASFFCVRDVFNQVGGFDDKKSAGEDSDLGTRLHAEGFRIKLEPGCRIIHWGYPSTLRGVIERQAWHVGGRSGDTPVLRDATVLAALAVVFFHLSSVILVAFGRWELGIVALLLGLTPPVLFVRRRKKRVGARLSATNNLQALVVAIAYFVGRAKGALYRLLGLEFRRSHRD